MQIAIASGKGGTGKTLIATSLATWWADNGRPVVYVDVDVEEPNGHLFLKPDINAEHPCGVSVPFLTKTPCAGHARCQEACAFNAILSAKGQIVVFHELCHSCGACIIACPDDALSETERTIGTISVGRSGELAFVSGTLNVGEVRATPLIEGVLSHLGKLPDLAVVDAPPGTSCSAMAASRDADVLVLVTEPTPFGLHDLELAVGMGRALNKRLVSVINRADLGDDRTKAFLEREHIPILAEIPFSEGVAKRYAMAELPIHHSETFKGHIAALAAKLTIVMGEAP